MPYRIACPHCSTPIELADADADRTVPCPSCGQSFRTVSPSTTTSKPTSKTVDEGPSEPWLLWGGIAAAIMLVLFGTAGFFVFGNRVDHSTVKAAPAPPAAWAPPGVAVAVETAVDEAIAADPK